MEQRKIYIALVGAQPAPVCWGLVYFKPDKSILICSEQTEKVAKNIQSLFDCYFDICLCDSVDMDEIKKLCEELRSEYEGDEVMLNISGGTKAWTILFYESFRDLPSVHIVYIDQNNYCHDFVSMTSEQINLENMDVDNYLKLYGAYIKSCKYFSEYVADDEEVLHKLEYVRSLDNLSFNRLVAVLDRDKQEQVKNEMTGEFTLDNGSSVSWDKALCSVTFNIKGEVVVLKSPNVMSMAFNSGWFEYKAALAFSRIEGVEDVRLNCLFCAQNNMPKNEVDIILFYNRKLFFVECKTQINNATDIDKFRSALRNYAGTGAKGILVSNAKLYPNVREKCADNNILYFSFNDSFSFADNIKYLKGILHKELKKINIR